MKICSVIATMLTAEEEFVKIKCNNVADWEWYFFSVKVLACNKHLYLYYTGKYNIAKTSTGDYGIVENGIKL